MKIRDVRAAIEKTAAIHRRLGSLETASSLHALSDTICPFDDKSVAAFVKLVKGNQTDDANS